MPSVCVRHRIGLRHPFMIRCPRCRVLWPFAFAIALSALLSFPAWATLELATGDPAAQALGTALFFCVSATTLVLYVRWCMRHNCAQRISSGSRRTETAR
jgi:hypothetical protein